MRVRVALFLLLIPACASRVTTPRSPELRVSPAAQAQDPDADYPSEFYARTGLLLGVRAHGALLGGDFDGDTTLTGPDTIFLSETDPGTGYELVIGGLSEGSSVEVSYTRIHYDGEFAGAPGDVSYRAFEIRGVNYWRANSAVQPLGFIGLLFPLADIEDGSREGGNVGTAKLRRGIGFELGGGLACWLTRRLALDLRASAVLNWFNQAEGVADDPAEIDEDVFAPSYGLSLGLCWVPGGTS